LPDGTDRGLGESVVQVGNGGAWALGNKQKALGAYGHDDSLFAQLSGCLEGARGSANGQRCKDAFAQPPGCPEG